MLRPNPHIPLPTVSLERPGVPIGDTYPTQFGDSNSDPFAKLEAATHRKVLCILIGCFRN